MTSTTLGQKLADIIEAYAKAHGNHDTGWEEMSRTGIALDDFCLEFSEELVELLRGDTPAATPRP